MISNNKFGLVLFQASNIISPLIILMFCTTYLGMEIYGWYVFNYSIFILLSYLINFGTTSSTIAISIKHNYSDYALFFTVIFLKLTLTLILIAGGVTVVFFYNPTLINNINPYFFFLIIYEVLSSDWKFYKQEKLIDFGLFYFIFRFLPLVGLINATDLNRYLLFCVINSIILGILIFLRLKPEKKTFTFEIFKEILKKLIPFFPNYFLGKARLLGGKILLGGVDQMNELAYYDAVDKLKSLSNVPSQIQIDSKYADFTTNPTKKKLKRDVKLIFLISLSLNLFTLVMSLTGVLDSFLNIQNLDQYYFYIIPLSIITNLNYIKLKYILVGTSLTKELNTLSVLTTTSYFVLLVSILILNYVNFRSVIFVTTISGIISLLYIQIALNKNGYNIYK